MWAINTATGPNNVVNPLDPDYPLIELDINHQLFQLRVFNPAGIFEHGHPLD